jgi:exopolysaccharide biosynthesis polyprenyl glycosylphosphotransferase
MMALPFFAVLYHIQITTLFLVVLIESICMLVWLLFFHRLWERLNPPLPTVVFCSDRTRGRAIAKKINISSVSNRVNDVMLYENSDLERAIERYATIVLVNPPDEIKTGIAFRCWEMHKELIIVPEVYELIVNNAELVEFDDLMAYRTKSMGLTRQQRIIKRTADIIGSAAALILLSPLYLVIALIVKRDGGPALFAQKRVTRGGRVFSLYKFRTMIPDAEKITGPTLAKKNDPRITKAGKWLRQTRLDELPQFWNTLIGDMSLVGPRPEREHFINLYMETIPEYQYRTNVRAGITGLAHVHGKYNTTPEERIRLDLTYIQNYSLLLDIKILLETVRVVFTKENAEGIEPAEEHASEKNEKEFAREGSFLR